MSNKTKTRKIKKMKGEMTMGKKISNRINDNNEVMALIYALYMTVGSLFGSVSCMFEKEKNFFRSRYIRMASAAWGYGIEELCINYLEKDLKRKLEMDPSYECVDSYIYYDKTDNTGGISFANNRVYLNIEIGKTKGGDFIITHNELVNRRKSKVPVELAIA